MNPTKPDDMTEEQHNEQQQTTERKERRNGMEAPVAASRRDVMEAENKADDAQREAKEAKRMTVEEIENLRRDLEEIADDLEETRDELTAAEEEIEQQLSQLFSETTPKQFGRTWSRDSIVDGIKSRLPSAGDDGEE
jgi:septal ring factor EnvC (AmiA/AmiB activator)